MPKTCHEVARASRLYVIKGESEQGISGRLWQAGSAFAAKFARQEREEGMSGTGVLGMLYEGSSENIKSKDT
jgi:hypothetical protein